MAKKSLLFIEPACGERDIIATTSVRCMCLQALCVRSDLSGSYLEHLCMDVKYFGIVVFLDE